MKKYIIFCLLITVFACEKNNSDDTTDEKLWAPTLIGIMGDGHVQLTWFNYFIWYKMSIPVPQVQPDRFKIYISKKDKDHFEELVALRNESIHNYEADNLENGEPYYFYIMAEKMGYIPKLSDTIMVIPCGNCVPVDSLVLDDSHTVLGVAYARGLQKIAYTDLHFSWDGGENCCAMPAIFISNLDGSGKEMLDTNAYDPDWSPLENKVIFRTEKNKISNSNLNTAQIALYDYNTKSITRLTDDNGFNYAPVFSENGEKVLYLKGTNSYYGNNIWLLNLATNEKRQLTHSENSGYKNFGKPVWINNQEYLYATLTGDYRYRLYKSAVNSSTITPVIQSSWDEYCPSISPDGKNLAFISDRSGYNEVWVYNMENQTYKQLTGYSFQNYLNTDWCRIDWIDNTHIIFTLDQNKLMKVGIE